MEANYERELRLSLVTLLARITMATVFFFFGLGKFLGGYMNFVNWMLGTFKDAKLPPHFMLVPFTYVLPFAEITFGLLLLAGLFTRWTFFFAGLLIAALIFGQIQLQHADQVASHLLYFLSIATGLWASEGNRFSLDYFLQRNRD